VPEAAAKARGRPRAAAAVLPADAVAELHKLARTADTKGAWSAASPEGGPPPVSAAALEMTRTYIPAQQCSDSCGLDHFNIYCVAAYIIIIVLYV
jgi:hypothetical protein